MFIAIGPDSFKNHWINILVQIPFVVVFSYMIDAATFFLRMMLPDTLTYLISWGLVIGGTLLLSFSISISLSFLLLSWAWFPKKCDFWNFLRILK